MAKKPTAAAGPLNAEQADAAIQAAIKTGDAEKIVAARKSLADSITEGAEPCPDCGNMPHGMIQPKAVAGFGIIETYEIGCLVDRDHRAVGKTREEAVENWNAGEYLPPREEPTIPEAEEK